MIDQIGRIYITKLYPVCQVFFAPLCPENNPLFVGYEYAEGGRDNIIEIASLTLAMTFFIPRGAL
jgi:hypothetical protein